MKKYTDEELITLIRKLAREIGQIPTIRSINSADGYPKATVFTKRFGSWNNALLKAGLEPRHSTKGKNKTSAEMLDDLRKKAKELGHAPSFREVDQDTTMCSAGGYRTHFKASWADILKMAGLKPRRNQWL